MSNSLRSQTLQMFKSLHKTRKCVFEGDSRALEAARVKINEEFRKNKDVTDTAQITEKLEFAKAVEHELRSNVIQGVEVEPGKYRMRITPETTKFDNKPYKECENG